MATKKQEYPEGLNQTFVGKDKKKYTLKSVLNDSDWWETKGEGAVTILKHEAVKKIARIAGYTVVRYDILISPTVYNNMTITVSPKIEDSKGEILPPEMGEASRDNLGGNGRRYPVAIAQKRAFDRTVLSALGISGVLSEDQLIEEDNKPTMDNLSHKERKEIAPLINQLLLAKKKQDLAFFSKHMPEHKKKMELNEAQIDYIKKLYKKRLAELQKVNF
jgi:hypothetical protein